MNTKKNNFHICFHVWPKKLCLKNKCWSRIFDASLFFSLLCISLLIFQCIRQEKKSVEARLASIAKSTYFSKSTETLVTSTPKSNLNIYTSTESSHITLRRQNYHSRELLFSPTNHILNNYKRCGLSKQNQYFPDYTGFINGGFITLPRNNVRWLVIEN